MDIIPSRKLKVNNKEQVYWCLAVLIQFVFEVVKQCNLILKLYEILRNRTL